jgi:hypothetical protein
MSQVEWNDLEAIKQDIIDDKAFVDVWDCDDIHACAELDELELTDSQCKEVIVRLKRTYDCSIGVDWELVQTHIADVIRIGGE